jgi:hypothetical protein
MKVRFQGLAAARMKMTVFWDVAWWKLTNVSEVLTASIALKMEAVTSETMVNFYETKRLNIPEDSHLGPILNRSGHEHYVCCERACHIEEPVRADTEKMFVMFRVNMF